MGFFNRGHETPSPEAETEMTPGITEAVNPLPQPEEIIPDEVTAQAPDEASLEIIERRHPLKPKTADDAMEAREGEKLALGLDGIIEAQAAAVRYAESFKNAPAKTVVLGYVSNQGRTGEAASIFDQELRHVVEGSSADLSANENKTSLEPGLEDSKVFDLQEAGSLEAIAAQIDDQTDKVVIVNAERHSNMGMREWDMGALKQDMQSLGIDEVGALKKWLSEPETQIRYKVTPEQIAGEGRVFLQEQAAKMKELFPGRPVMINAIGHSWEYDAQIISFLNEKMSGETLEKLGGMIGTMEGAKITIQPDGEATISYRDMEARFSLNDDEVPQSEV